MLIIEGYEVFGAGSIQKESPLNVQEPAAKRYPFTTFDSYSFLIPGAIVLLCIFLFEHWAMQTIPIQTVSDKQHISQTVISDSIIVSSLITIQLTGIDTTQNVGQVTVPIVLPDSITQIAAYDKGSVFHTPLYTGLVNTFPSSKPMSWILSITYVIAFLIIAYVTGHCVASIASLVLNRMLVAKGYGYPIQTLLKINFRKLEELQYKKKYYRGMISFLNILFILLYVNFVIYNSPFGYPDDFLEYLIYILCAIILVVNLLKYINEFYRSIKIKSEEKLKKRKKELRERDKRLKERYKDLLDELSKESFERDKELFEERAKEFIEIKWMSKIIEYSAILYDIYSSQLAKFYSTKKLFCTEFRDKYKYYFYKNFGIEAEHADNNNYWAYL